MNPTAPRTLLSACAMIGAVFFFSSRRRHTIFDCDWSSDVCSSDLAQFLRDHLASLRAAKPLSLAARPASITDVRLYNVGASLTRSGIRIVGSTGSKIGRASCRERV